VRIAILSDIHGNREALEATLAHVSRQGADRVVVLGDIVGYGADPVFCVETVADLAGAGAVVVKGNHDEAVDLADPDMNREALAAIRWTHDQLAETHRSFLRGLQLVHRDGDALYAHAGARHPGHWPYILAPRDAELSLAATTARLVFSGHTHLPVLFVLQPNGICAPFIPATNEPVPLLAQRRWQVIVGSVGQPRDGSAASAYSLLDLGQGTLTQHRVAYDHQAAAAKILAAGLPHRLASRLAWGR
jgi:predicted phosphodiesterase